MIETRVSRPGPVVACDVIDGPADTNYDGTAHYCQACGSSDHAVIEKAKPAATKRPSAFSLAVLAALNLGAARRPGATSRHIYGGTVPDGVKQARRRRNRAAGRSRRINRARRCAR